MSSSRRSDSSDDEPDLTAERDALKWAVVAALSLGHLRWRRSQVAAPANPEMFERFERFEQALVKLTPDVLRASKELRAAIDDEAAETQLQRVLALLTLEESTETALVAYAVASAALTPAAPNAETELQTMLRAEAISAAARSAQDRKDAES
jgi:hypothetical protein